MFESDPADTCAEKFPLKSIGGRVKGLACADPAVRTPISVSRNISNMSSSVIFLRVSQKEGVGGIIYSFQSIGNHIQYRYTEHIYIYIGNYNLGTITVVAQSHKVRLAPLVLNMFYTYS